MCWNNVLRVACYVRHCAANTGDLPSFVSTCKFFRFIAAWMLPCLAKGALEAKYKEELDETFGIVFNNLFTITNMPIKVQSNSSQTACTFLTTKNSPSVKGHR